MATNTTRIDPGANILIPSDPNAKALMRAVGVGASLTVTRGQAMAIKTADGRAYPLNVIASDGTQLFAGFSAYSFSSDSTNLIYFQTSGTPVPTPYTGFASTTPIYISGVFNANDLYTAPTGAPVAEIDTATPAGTITAADDFIIDIPNSGAGPDTQVIFTAVSGSVTPTNIVTGLKAAWAANPIASALATPTGTATLILTAKTAGEPMNLVTYCEGVGTFVNVVTAGTAGQQAEVDTFTYTTAPSTGDTFTLTVTYPNGTTLAATATVGATATVAATTVLMAAAWNAVPALALIATATSTGTTVVLTGVNVASTFSVASTTTSVSTTVAKVVTKPALGRNISDILAGNPTAHIDYATGWWVIGN